MEPVRTVPRYRCDFCRHTSTRTAMEKHERRCFKNPNRWCSTCRNTGEVPSYPPDNFGAGEPCHFCTKRKVITVNYVERGGGED
jgi:hypothetical protein